MERRPTNAEVIRRWVDANEAWLDGLTYGGVEFVFTGGQRPRINKRDSEVVPLDDDDRSVRLTA